MVSTCHVRSLKNIRLGLDQASLPETFTRKIDLGVKKGTLS